jgi:hypothetical protein
VIKISGRLASFRGFSDDNEFADCASSVPTPLPLSSEMKGIEENPSKIFGLKAVRVGPLFPPFEKREGWGSRFLHAEFDQGRLLVR